MELTRLAAVDLVEYDDQRNVIHVDICLEEDIERDLFLACVNRPIGEYILDRDALTCDTYVIYATGDNLSGSRCCIVLRS